MDGPLLVQTAAATIGSGWAAKKLLGPTLDQVGTDLKTLYETGKNKIIEKGSKKIKNIDDGKIANLRVARDVFWSGSFSDSNITAEYFGGILASSRTDDGGDDTGIYYLDIIKGLSSKQLHLHYLIYNTLNKYFLSNIEKQGINVALDTDLNTINLYFGHPEIEAMDIDINLGLVALFNKGLIGRYHINTKLIKVEDKEVLMSYCFVTPTTLGIQLYMTSQNNLDKRRAFPNQVLPDFEEIELPTLFADSLEALTSHIQ